MTEWTPDREAEYMRNYRENHKKERKESYRKNRTENIEAAKQWAAKHPERRAANQRKYLIEHRAELNAKRRERRKENPQKARAGSSKWYYANREKILAAERDKHAKLSPEEKYIRNLRDSLRAKYNMTIPEYNALLAAQNGVCAICKEPPKHGRRRLDIDHDHETKEIRGLLCSPCNVALYHFEQYQDRLTSLVAYLKKT